MLQKWTHSEASEDVRSRPYADADHTVDPADTDGAVIPVLQINSSFMHIKIDWPSLGEPLTWAESTQRATFQPARPWWGSGIWRQTGQTCTTHSEAIFVQNRIMTAYINIIPGLGWNYPAQSTFFSENEICAPLPQSVTHTRWGRGERPPVGPARPREPRQSAVWSPACPRSWTRCWSTTCLERYKQQRCNIMEMRVLGLNWSG